MDSTFEYRLSREEYVVGLLALQGELASRDRSAGRRSFERLAVAVPVMVFVMLVFPDAVAGLLATALLVALIETAMRPRWLRSATGQSYDPSVADLRVEVSDSGVGESSPGRRREWRWAAVRGVHDRGSAVVIELAGWDMIVLPARLWADEAGKAGFVDWVQARLPEGAAGPAAQENAPTAEIQALLTVGSLAAAVDLLFLLSDPLLRFVQARAPLAGHFGFAGAMGLVLILYAAIAWPACLAARAGLLRLHAARPAAAKLAAHAAIWALPLYMLGAYSRLI